MVPPGKLRQILIALVVLGLVVVGVRLRQERATRLPAGATAAHPPPDPSLPRDLLRLCLGTPPLPDSTLARVRAILADTTAAPSIERRFLKARVDDEARAFDSACVAYAKLLDELGDGPGVRRELRAGIRGRLAWAEERRGNYLEARPLYERALADWRASGTADSLEVGLEEARLAIAYSVTGDSTGAEVHFGEATRIQCARGAGGSLRDCVWTRNSYAGHLQRGRRVDEALAIYDELVRICPLESNGDSLQLGWICNDYGVALHTVGRMKDAEEQYARAMELRAMVGAPKEFLLTSMVGCVSCLIGRGEYREAILLEDRVLRVAAEVHGEETPEFGSYLQAAGSLQLDIGDTAGAVVRLERASELLEAGGEPFRRSLGSALRARAEILSGRGAVEPAILLFLRDREIVEQEYGERSIIALRLRRRIAELRARRGWTTEVDAEFREILRLMVEHHPANRADYGWAATKYADALVDAGQLEAAFGWFDRGLTALREELPEEHVSVEACRLRLAGAAARTGRLDRAWSEALAAERIGSEQYLRTIRAMTERGAVLYLESRMAGLDLLLDLAATDFADDPERVGEAWQQSMTVRASILKEAVRRMRFERDAGKEDQLEHVEAIREFSELCINEPESGSDPHDRDRFSAAKARLEDSERRLTLAALNEDEERGPTIEDLRGALPAGFALVSFVLSNRSRHPRERQEAYSAFVMTASGGPPRLVRLGGAARVDSLVEEIGLQMAEAPRRLELDARSAESRYKSTARELAALIWDPLVPFLGAADSVLIVPDGHLHLVNPYALVDAAGGYLAESSRRFGILTDEGAIVDAPPGSGSGLMVAVGGAEFSSPIGPEADAATEFANSRGRLPIDCAGWRERTWGYLPASAEEVREIGEYWARSDPAADREVLILSGREAGEARLKAVAPGARMLHIASHAFSFPASCFAGARAPAAMRGTGSGSLFADDAYLMLGSGIVLAGANDRNAEDGEDGYLTPREVAAMDLRNLDWAVLSACGTAAGTVTGLEGVFGLPRAFRIAGARTVVANLWSVDDEATFEWMRSLYAHRLVGRLSAMDAWKETNVEIMNRLRSGGKSTHPFLWAGPIVVGDWR